MIPVWLAACIGVVTFVLGFYFGLMIFCIGVKQR